MVDTDADRLGALFASHESILVFTGAGISTASGIPDFRGPGGVWNTRRPIFYQDFMASVDARRGYWQQKLEDRDHFGEAAPNEVHAAIVALEAAGKVAKVVTQNVDGLHRAAGTSQALLIEIHGTAAEIECQSCGARSAPEDHFRRFSDTGVPPDCACGGHLKTATISFGQQLRQADLREAFAAAERCDLVVSLGSTLSVAPAADIPLTAAAGGVPYAIVNRGPTDHDGVEGVVLRVEGDVTEVVPRAVELALS